MLMSSLREFFVFLIVRKKYWMLPAILLLGLLGALIVLSQSSPLAPFIYTLF